MGGIAAAIALLKEGYEPLVLEQAEAISVVGAGIHLYPNALKVLDHLGVADYVRASAVVSEEEIFKDLYTGERIAQRQLFGSVVARRYDEFCYAVHRAALLEALLSVLPDKYIRLNSRVAGVSQTEKGVQVRLESGEEIEGDLLIGADGLKSQVRAELFGNEAPRFMNYVGWRAVFPMSAMRQRPVRGFTLWSGLNRNIGWYPIGRDLIYLGSLLPVDQIHEESWTSAGLAENLIAAVPDACAEVMDAFDALANHALSVAQTGYYYRDPLPSWSKGRVTLLGDAAHPSPPAAGQGSGMAFEDAVMLARSLRRHGPASFSDALREYELRRMPRTSAMNRAALSLMNYRAEDPDKVPMEQAVRAREIRHRRLRTLARLDPVGELTFGWLMKFDPVQAASLSFTEERAANSIEQPPERPEALKAFSLWKNAITQEDRITHWHGERAAYERLLAKTSETAPKRAATPLDCNGVPALKLGDGKGPVVLHLHGGGYSLGSAEGGIDLADRLAEAVGGWALIPDYSLAPERPWPAAPQDVLNVYRWLAKECGASNIIVSGNCAGGGLALGLAIALRDAGEPGPAGLHLLSPFLDLSLTALSIDRNANSDPLLSRPVLTQFAASYIPENSDPARPDISPLFAHLNGLPPTLVQVAANEALRDDAARFAIIAEKEGVDVTLEVVPDTVHSFLLFDFLPETAQGIEQLRVFSRKVLAGRLEE